MNTTKLIAVPALMGALFVALSGQQAQAADTGSTLSVQNYTSVTSTPSLTMTPLLSEIVAGSVETLSGIDLTVVTNNSTGCKITVSAGAAGANKIAPGHISLRVAAPGNGAAAGDFGNYTALSTGATDLWNTEEAQLNGTGVELDVKFSNLSSYPAVAGATKNYTNTITFTAVANS
ncbi:MAG TPA: hypothetical protein VGB45_01460 [Abditibacterium sp.]